MRIVIIVVVNKGKVVDEYVCMIVICLCIFCFMLIRVELDMIMVLLINIFIVMIIVVSDICWRVILYVIIIIRVVKMENISLLFIKSLFLNLIKNSRIVIIVIIDMIRFRINFWFVIVDL